MNHCTEFGLPKACPHADPSSIPHPAFGHPLPSDGRGPERENHSPPHGKLRDWICWTVSRKTRIGQQAFPLLGERIKGEGGRNTLIKILGLASAQAMEICFTNSLTQPSPQGEGFYNRCLLENSRDWICRTVICDVRCLLLTRILVSHCQPSDCIVRPSGYRLRPGHWKARPGDWLMRPHRC